MVSRAEIVTSPALLPIKPRLVNVLALAVAVSRATIVAVNDQVELAGILMRLVEPSTAPPFFASCGSYEWQAIGSWRRMRRMPFVARRAK